MHSGKAPGGASGTMESRHQARTAGAQLPLIMEPERGGKGTRPLAEFITAHSDTIERQLLAHGAILFRGFAVNDAADFSAAGDSLGGVSMEYFGGTVPRGRIAKQVFNSTELSGALRIRLHNELAYQKHYPDRLLFYCHLPSRRGGETIVADTRKIYRALPRRIVDAFERRQVLYVRNFRDASRAGGWRGAASPKLAWQQALGAQTRAEAEARCAALGMEFCWHDDGGLQVRNILPATKLHPRSGEACWFNQILALNVSRPTYGRLGYAIARCLYRDTTRLPMNSYFGDGEPIPDDVIRQIEQISDAHIVALPWQRGDVMMVDNHSVAHGRNPYRGRRKVMVSMLQMPSMSAAAVVS